jgi:argonaute-like protein implicated in RNA metabolism and viral defense
MNVQTSMAQVFTHNGEGIVLRGTDVFLDKRTREPHMSERQSNDLMAEALKTYESRAGRKPARVTIHKTSTFYREEISGIDKAIGPLLRDFVTINSRHSFRFVRDGQYPILRGTMIRMAGDQCLLYTTGYIPRIRTYPGHRIPNPLLITHRGDSEITEVCKEIMGLTKLNWNTAAFATFLPITLEFSQRVGRVLSEMPEGKPLQNHYRFYM